MCQRAVCRTCGKITYTGCGRHVDQVLAGVPASERCKCSSGNDDSSRKSWSLFGRR
jgi:hypothetical protein